MPSLDDVSESEASQSSDRGDRVDSLGADIYSANNQDAWKAANDRAGQSRSPGQLGELEISDLPTQACRSGDKKVPVGAPAPPSAGVLRIFEQTATRIDKDGDGFVSRTDVDLAVQDPTFRGEQAELIVVLKQHFNALTRLSADGADREGQISVADIRAFHEMQLTARKSGTPNELVSMVDRTMARMRREITGSSRELFASTDSPLASITPEAVRQGDVGNCYFLAALASLAQVNPGAIKSMIKDNGDSTYTVCFPGAPDEPITIAAPTQQELGLYAGAGPHGIWPAVMEKAYGAYCNASLLRRSPFNLAGSVVPQEGSDGGSVFNAGLRILAATDVSTSSNFLSTAEQIDETLSSAFSDKRPVTAYINKPLLGLTNCPDGVIDGHEYSVLGYDAKTKTITLRNPWGHCEPRDQSRQAKDGKDDGVFTMSLDEFKRTFSGLAYAQKGNISRMPQSVLDLKQRVKPER